MSIILGPIKNRARDTAQQKGGTVCGCRPLLLYLRQNCSVGFNWNNIHPPTSFVKQDIAVAQREQSVILAHPDIAAWMPFGSALTRENVSRNDSFTTEFFDPESLRGRIATVAAGTLSLLMSHFTLLRQFLCDKAFLTENAMNR